MADAAALKDRRLSPATLSSWLPGALVVFVASAFLLPSEPAYALVFYVAVLPCLAARLCAGPWPRLTDPALLAALALVMWSGLTLLWGIDDGHRSFRFAGDTVATLALLLAMAATLPDAGFRARLGTVLVACGAVNAAWSIGLAVVTHAPGQRLHGWGATTHPILGAAVIATSGLTALARGLVPAAPRSDRALNLAAFGLVASFMLLTESRGPLLAAGLATILLCAASVWRLRAFLALGAGLAIWASLPAATKKHTAYVLVERGSSHRFQIWDYTLGLIRDRPLFGHGLAANLHLDIGDVITFPHDLYLSLLFYSGIVGFGLFLAMAGLLTWRLRPGGWRGRWRNAEWAWLAALWVNLLVAGLTDLGQITKGPGPLWFIVWVPVGLLLGATGRASALDCAHGSGRRPSSIRRFTAWRLRSS
jgi:O-antigen ligase